MATGIIPNSRMGKGLRPIKAGESYRVKEVNLMMTKRLIILLMATAFVLGVVSPSFSAQEIKGTVSKIDGNKLTLVDDTGKEKTVTIKDKESLKEVKVGDRVSVKDGKVIKENT